MGATRRFEVDAEDDGERLDRYLDARSAASRSQLQRLIRAGDATVNGRPAKASLRLRAGDAVALAIRDEPPAPGLAPEPGPLAVLYEDAHLAVIDKPAGLAVHPGAGRDRGTLANRLVARWPDLAATGHPGRPGIVHRLDKDTTGVLVVARSDAAYQALARAFADRAVAKTYLAIVHGVPAEERGTVDLPIARHRVARKTMAVRDHGRPAVTHFARRAEAGRAAAGRAAAGRTEAGGCALLELDLETGRTHQIRVHMKAVGHPLVGDPIYGEARWRAALGGARRALARFPRPALHAWRLTFDHPVRGERLRFEAPVPEDLRELWHALGGRWPAADGDPPPA